MRRVSQPGLKRGALQDDTADIGIGETFDAGIFLAKAHAPRQQHDRRVKRQATEVSVEWI